MNRIKTWQIKTDWFKITTVSPDRLTSESRLFPMTLFTPYVIQKSSYLHLISANDFGFPWVSSVVSSKHWMLSHSHISLYLNAPYFYDLFKSFKTPQLKIIL